jgi:hypothetical protein
MSNENQYFPHDYNARNDVKIIKLLRAKGLAGLGLYWCIVEYLYQAGGKMKIEECNCIAFALHTHFEDVYSIVADYDLFDTDGVEFWSKSIFRRLDKRKEVSEKRKKAAEARWRGQIPMQMQCKSDANAMQVDANIKYKNINNNITHTITRTREEELTQDLRENQSWQEMVLMRFKISKESLLKYIDEFELEQKCKNVTHANDADIKAHIADWLRRQIQELQKEQNNGKSKQLNNKKDTGIHFSATSAEDYEDWIQG